MLLTADHGITAVGAVVPKRRRLRYHRLADVAVLKPERPLVPQMVDRGVMAAGVVVPAKKLLQTAVLRALPDGHSAHVPVRLSHVRLMNLRQRKQIP